MPITPQQLRAEFTSQLVAVYQERIFPTLFGRSFFRTVTAPTKYVSIEVERMGENMSVDVLRGTEGTRNTFSKSTAKIYLPPYWHEFFDATDEDLYDRVLGSMGTANAPLFTALLNRISDRLGTLQDKIERAKELQCWQVLLTGIVTMNNGDNIDFTRKAESLVDLTGAGGYFAANSQVFDQFEAACNFIRGTGRCADGTFNAVLGSTALADLLKNTNFTARQNLFNMALDQVQGPARNGVGATFHGTITAGSYKVQLWAYPQFYKHPTTGTLTPYMDPKKVVVLPTAPQFIYTHAAVPQLIGEPGQMPAQGEYMIGEYLDHRRTAHEFDIRSAGLPVPVAVDQIYTMKAVTG